MMPEIEKIEALEKKIQEEAKVAVEKESMADEGIPTIDIDQELRTVTLCLVQLKKARAALKGLERFIDLVGDDDDEGLAGGPEYRNNLKETYERIGRVIGETQASIEIFKDF